MGVDEEKYINSTMDCFSVKIGHELRIIDTKSLLAVEVNDYICKFYIEYDSSFSSVDSLKNILSKLPDYFIRISRNCIINALHIKSIDFKRREVKLSGDKIFSISVRNARVLKRKFSW